MCNLWGTRGASSRAPPGNECDPASAARRAGIGDVHRNPLCQFSPAPKSFFHIAGGWTWHGTRIIDPRIIERRDHRAPTSTQLRTSKPVR
ncbi:BZ3500_MvSof-1268-A1-R1_Chr9g10472 [Microbotryum saponariae]|uniref:BZ3500_MvSof-1268-A1-R1_Chr9g10472 protein n=1 Tax=Microbotryum saponariae TaxID=289078 RepID=A0A2X0KTS6_9BASI|nr:BZ3501_MvSof-1269-A2-R1_Chr9g10222 [Microbotryum saponariae]SDA00147.1 BZ3500_MvSof-1268-A1-R1_Chr9g10472 [Microbotryum saponariae]